VRIKILSVLFPSSFIQFFRSSHRNGISKRRIKVQKIYLKIMRCFSGKPSLMRNYARLSERCTYRDDRSETSKNAHRHDSERN